MALSSPIARYERKLHRIFEQYSGFGIGHFGVEKQPLMDARAFRKLVGDARLSRLEEEDVWRIFEGAKIKGQRALTFIQFLHAIDAMAETAGVSAEKMARKIAKTPSAEESRTVLTSFDRGRRLSSHGTRLFRRANG